MKLISFIVFLFLTPCVHAQVNYNHRHLTTEDIERVRVVKGLLGGVDKKSMQQTINELEKTRKPQLNLQMKEAMAKAYADIVRDYKVNGQKKKEWLYSMVCLNMAYLQFGGDQGKAGNATSLNKLIRQELKKYLPADLLHQPGFLYSL